MTLFLFPLLSLSVYASQEKEEALGCIQIMLEEDDSIKEMNENVIFYISKVGEYVNGEYDFYPEVLKISEDTKSELTSATVYDFVEQLSHSIDPESAILYRYKEEMTFNNLEDGLYLLYAEVDNEEFLFEPSFLTIPYFDEENKEMNYTVQVYPKYARNEPKVVIPPKTGDDVDFQKPLLLTFSSVLVASVLLFVLLKNKKCK